MHQKISGLYLIIKAGFSYSGKSAAYMQDLFENKPAGTAVTAIEINIKQRLKESEIPSPHQPQNI